MIEGRWVDVAPDRVEYVSSDGVVIATVRRYFGIGWRIEGYGGYRRSIVTRFGDDLPAAKGRALELSRGCLLCRHGCVHCVGRRP